ncbi:hypothetical protein HYT56_01175 [Candidatus Woesearchaeota archaeon]|nr:hypothetical protein [Candidatus Woesearchaeota archaeon]
MKKLIFLGIILISLIFANNVLAESSVVEDIPLGSNISDTQTYTFNQELTDADIPDLLDGTITFQDAEYDVEEFLELNQAGNSIKIETSLTSSEDDYGSGIFFEVSRDSIKYYYAFSEAIQVNKTTSSDPLTIKFLGKTIKITDIDDSTEGKFTAYVGSEYFMDSGDSVVVEGKTVKLVRVGSAGAIVVDVGGVTDTISSGSTKTVNGIEIVNDETFYDSDNQAASSATLIIGKDAQETYKDGDAYVGENPDDPDWIWNVNNIKSGNFATTSSTTAEFTGPYFGIENDFIYNDDSDNPPSVGECLNLPNNYLSICIDSLTVADNNYADYIFEYETSADLSDAVAGLTSAKAVLISTLLNDGIEILRDSNAGIDVNGSNTSPIYTNQIWLYTQSDDPNAEYGNPTNIGLFYKDVAVDNKVKLAGTIPLDNPKTNGFARINYDNTKGTNIQLYLANDAAGHKLTLVPYHTTNLPDYNDNISMTWGLDSGKFKSLGSTSSLAESAELQWTGTDFAPTTPVNIGVKDEDHRSRYGIIIKNPYLHGSSDEVELSIPGDQVQANVVIKTNNETGGGAGGGAGGGVGVTDEIRYNISLNQGWNLISIPLILSNNSIEEVMKDIKDNINVIYGYNPSTTEKWEIYRPDSEITDTLSMIDPGKAYWIKMDNPDVLSVNGTIDVKSGDAPGVIPTFKVSPGWNLIGYYGTKDETASTALQNVDGKYSAIWTLFTDNIQTLQGALKGIDFSKELKLLHGYWIFFKEEGAIVPTS